MSRIVSRQGDAPRRSLWDRIKDLARRDVSTIARGGLDGSLEGLEDALIAADFGVLVTLRLIAEVERRAKLGELKSDDALRNALRDGIEAALRAGNSDPSLVALVAAPTVVLVMGVNGAGKTTFIGKLSARFRAQGKKVLLAAADTFRAGATDQLKVWAERTGADFVGAGTGADPASVAFQAIDAASARGADVVIVDTAGRLHTSAGLMEELKKVARVIAKRLPGAPHETLLVLDGTIGQNAVQQAKEFSVAVPATGIVVTKLDGSARGGVVVAVHEAIDVPVKFIGVGETAADLEVFDAGAFARSLL
ncbi:MAG TPA: signal recognition particle-docking protein FtsY [Gemmatimonadaceae bacterium]